MIQECPEKSKLAAFSVGDLGQEEFERLADHVDRCRDCDRLLRQLDTVQDEFVDRLKILGKTSTRREVADVVTQCEREVVQLLENPVSCDVSFDAGKHYSRLLSNGICRIGRFELLEEIGVGSFGHVFRANDTELNRIVAVKIQRAGAIATDEEAKRFLSEARSIASLQHPLIVSLFDTGQTEEGVCFLVTEFVSGETLEAQNSKCTLSFSETAEMVALIADSLHYAHEKRVVHRDIKPSNILIDENGIPHVADFGLAKRDSGDTAMTSAGQIMGTPAYMSPEVAGGASHLADGRSDIYSLGVILFEMLAGEPPFQGTNRLLLLQVLEDEPRSPRRLNEKIPRDLETICLKAMSKLPGRRYATADDFSRDLRRWARGETISARPVGLIERFGRWCKKNPFAAALFLGITFSSIAGFAYLKTLNTWFVKEMALDNVRLYSDMMEEFNESYSDVRTEFMTHGNAGDKLPPLPATMQIDVAKKISSDTVMKVRIFSEYAFREELRPDNSFERETLAKFKQLIRTPPAPEKHRLVAIQPCGGKTDHFQFGEIKPTPQLEHFEFVDIDDQPFLKYSRAQIMVDSCIDCHNTHVDSPKTDWKTGDLAGVLTLTRPLDRDIQRARSGFRGASLLMASIAGLLTLCGFFLASQIHRSAIV